MPTNYIVCQTRLIPKFGPKVAPYLKEDIIMLQNGIKMAWSRGGAYRIELKSQKKLEEELTK